MDPQPGETLLPEEERMMSELLSDAEHQLMILGAQIVLREEQQEQGALFVQQEPPVPEIDIMALAAEGKSAEEIAVIAEKPLPVVKAMMKQA